LKNPGSNKAGYNVKVVFDGRFHIMQSAEGWRYKVIYDSHQVRLRSFNGEHLNTMEELRHHDVLAQEVDLEPPHRSAGVYGASLEITVHKNQPETSLVNVDSTKPEPDKETTFPLSVMYPRFNDIRLDFLNIAVIPNWNSLRLLSLLSGETSYTPDNEFAGKSPYCHGLRD
jgi:hypothetical protein